MYYYLQHGDVIKGDDEFFPFGHGRDPMFCKQWEIVKETARGQIGHVLNEHHSPFRRRITTLKSKIIGAF